MKVAELKAILTADDKQFRKAMESADQQGKATARSVEGAFSNLKLKIPSVQGGFVSLAGAANIAAGNVLTQVIGKIAGGMTDAVKAGIDYNKTLEASAVAFEVMGRSAADTQQHLKDLENLGLKTPFELQDLIKASIQMDAFGFSAKDRIKDLRQLADGASIAAAGTGNFTEALQGTITALGQMRAKGKLSAEEMNQLAERGIPAWDILAKKVGKTKEELMRLSEQGKLKGDVAARLLTEGIGQFAGGAGDRLSQTAIGKESNVKDAYAKRAGDDTKALFQSYKDSLDTAMKGLDADAGKGITSEIGRRLALDLDLGNAIVQAVASDKPMEKVGELLKDMWVGAQESLRLTFSESGSGWWHAAEQGFVNSVSGGAASVAETVKGWAGGVTDSVKSALGIKSPSRVFAEIGAQTIAGFEQGFDNGKKKIRATLADIDLKPEAVVNRLIDRTSEGMKKWGAAIKNAGGEEFLKAVEDIGQNLKIDPNKLLNVMAFESGLDPAKKNPGKGNSASGLIQFTDATAEALGTTTDKLRSMDAISQLEYVKKYFEQFKSVADTQEAVYTAVLAGRPVTDPSQVLFRDKGIKSNKDPYYANRALDKDESGTVTAQEAAAMAYKQGFLKATRPLSEAALEAAPMLDAIAATGPKAKEAILKLGDLAAPIQALAASAGQRAGDGVRAKPFSGAIAVADSGIGSVSVSAGKDVLQLSQEVQNLKLQTSVATREVKALPPNLQAVAGGMSAVSQSAEETAKNLRDLKGSKTFAQLQKDADMAAKDNLDTDARFKRFQDFQARIGQDFDGLIDAMATGSENWKQAGVSVIKDVFGSLASEMMLEATGGKYSSIGGLLGGSLGSVFKGVFNKGANDKDGALGAISGDAGRFIVKDLATGSEKVAKAVTDSAAKTLSATASVAQQQTQQLSKIAVSNADMANCACAPRQGPSLLGQVLGAVIGAVGAGITAGMNDDDGGGGGDFKPPSILLSHGQPGMKDGGFVNAGRMCGGGMVGCGMEMMADGGSVGTRAGYAAVGRMIQGPGTGRSDSIPMWLSNGEYVNDAATVKALGPQFFQALPSMAKNKELLGAFASAGKMADGGMVGGGSGSSSGPMPTMFPPAQQRQASSQGAASGKDGNKVINITINIPISAPQGTIPPQTRQQVAAQTAAALQLALNRNA